jgi:16S rRNA (uracil1498-N3)-methyltransferase
MIRLFIQEQHGAYSAGLVIPLNIDQSRYLGAVMRLSVGDEVAIFNGVDGEWLTRIHTLTKKACHLELIEQVRLQPDVSGPLLLIALVKRARLETIIEKATELGVAQIQLLITRRTNADHTNVNRLQVIAQEAAEQTERLDVPQVMAPIKLEKWLQDEADIPLIYGDEDSTHGGNAIPPMLVALKGIAGPAAILIGPEGGFDETERATLKALQHAVAVNLGPRILRADTAAISALTLYQAICGDWR